MAGGALFVGGLIAASVAGSKANTAAYAVAVTDSEIQKMTKAIKELKAVADDFAEIDKMYAVLNQFWGRMLSECMSVASTDEALLTMIGSYMLSEDSPSYVYAMECTSELKNGATAYMDLITKQGITIPLPPKDDDDEKSSDDTEVISDSAGALASLDRTEHKKSGSLQSNHAPLIVIKQPIKILGNAQDALTHGHLDLYNNLLDQANEMTVTSVVSSLQAPIRSGAWFDIASLKANVGLF